jgi:hypothetical protein
MEDLVTSTFKRVTREELLPAADNPVTAPEQSIAHIKAKLAMAPIESHAIIAPAGYPLEKLARHAQFFADKVCQPSADRDRCNQKSAREQGFSAHRRCIVS